MTDKSKGGLRKLLVPLGFTLVMIWSCAGKQNDQESSKELRGDSDSNNGQGKELYVQNCGSCHQANGSGVPGMYPPLQGTKTVKGDKKKLIRIILEGQEGKIEVKGRSYDQEMPAQDHLKNEEIAKILSYVRKEFAGEASEVSLGDVKKLREASGGKEGNE